MDVLRLSPSRINDFNNCPALYKYRAILALPEPPSIEAERGKLIHSVLEDLFLEEREHRSLDTSFELLPVKWLQAVEAKPELENLVGSIDEWLDRARALLTSYFALENPQGFESTHREFHLELDLREDIYLHGYVDRIDVAPSGEVRIVDYKTGKSPKPGWEAKALFQLQVYAFLYLRSHGVLPKQLKLLYLGNQEQIVSQPTDNVIETTAKKLEIIGDDILQSIKNDHFPPKKTKLCDWCNFKNICPAFN